MRKLSNALLVLVGAMTPLVAACSGDSASSPPAAPTPTTASINVTVDTPIKVGATAQATGTAALSNGQNQPLTSGWQSDAPSVATVSPAGLVTGVANGSATIYVISDGRQGQQVVRVVPDYQGTWAGRTVVTSCAQTGAFASANFCSDFSAGSSDPYQLSLAQTGLSMTARLSYGSSIAGGPTPTSILPDGTTSFSTTIAVPSGIIIKADVAINSPSFGTLTGTINEVWTAPGFSGEGRLNQNIVATVRTSATASAVARDMVDGWRVGRLRMLERRMRHR